MQRTWGKTDDERWASGSGQKTVEEAERQAGKGRRRQNGAEKEGVVAKGSQVRSDDLYSGPEAAPDCPSEGRSSSVAVLAVISVAVVRGFT